LILTRVEKTREIVKVDLEENGKGQFDGKPLQEVFEAKCKEGAYYQLQVGELLASMPACYYLNTIGLNDTMIFQADSPNQNLVGFRIEMKDLKHLASLERNPKKKRLMLEKQFNSFAGNAFLTKVFEGSRPTFVHQEYDTLGME